MNVKIIGPNLLDQSKGTFCVHADGCADIAKMARRDPAFADGLREPSVAVNSMEDVVLFIYGPDAGDFDLDPDNCDDIASYMSEFHFAPCTNSLPQFNNNTTEEVTNMSPRTTNAAAAKKTGAKKSIVKKSVAKKSSPAPTQKSKTVTLNRPNAKRNSVQFKATGKDPLVTAAYVSNDALALLDGGQKTIDLTFAPAVKQPKNSVRFDEQGKDRALGSLYLMREQVKVLGITEKTPKVKVRLERAGQGVKLTVSIA